MKRALLFLCILAILILPLGIRAEEKPLTSNSEVSFDATPIKRAPPIYPLRMAEMGREGWVDLSFTVQADGSVTDVVVIDHSVSGFDTAARKAVKRWKYRPATRDGVPISRSNVQVRLTFQLLSTQETRIRSSLYRKLRRLPKLIKSRDFDKAKQILEDAQSEESLTIDEQTYISTQWFDYYVRRGNQRAALRELQRAGPGVRDYLGEELYARLLLNKFSIEASLGLYTGALETYRDIQHLSEKYQSDSVDNAVDQIEELHLAGPPIRVAGKISETCPCDEQGNKFWSYRAFRRHLGFKRKSGVVSHLVARCDTHITEELSPEDLTVHLQNDWGACTVFVYGEADAKFDIIETVN